MIKNKKFIISVPKHISCFFDKITGILIFKNNKKITKIYTKIYVEIQRNSNKIYVTNKSIKKISNNEKKLLKAAQGLVVAKIKLAIYELSEIFCKKLKFVGLGYRIIPLKKLKLSGFYFKLGLSHSLFLNPTNNQALKMINLKYTKLYIYGTSYNQVCQASAIIRSYKAPEPYKGKGILYVNEKIKIKEGKKL